MASEEKIDSDKESEPGPKGYEDWMNFNVASRLFLREAHLLYVTTGAM